MRVLIVKTSSMGDVIHTFPAITDARRALPDVTFDWVVEEGFAEIPRWHDAVEDVIAVAIRRWRKRVSTVLGGSEWREFRQALRRRRYDCVIDAQGLVKSAWICRLVDAPRFGYDRASVRERLASFAYDRRIRVSKELHAVERIRRLFAVALGYPVPDSMGDSNLDRDRFGTRGPDQEPGVVFLHGTTRPDKFWPESHWSELRELATSAGLRVHIPWHGDEEKKRAGRIGGSSDRAVVLPKSGLAEVAATLARASAFVAVDTGLGHLGAAFGVPGISLYGPTNPALVGAYGKRQIHLISSDFPATEGGNVVPQSLSRIGPGVVWDMLKRQLALGISPA